MFIIIKDNHTIKKYNLNSDIYYKGISIYHKNNNYYIDLKTGLFFSDNSKSKVLNIGRYDISINDAYYSISIFVYKDDCGINDFYLYNRTDFLVAHNLKANIYVNDEYLNNYYLVCKHGQIETNFDISVNGNGYDGSKLKQGDVIEYIGIKIVYFENFLYINNFNVDVRIKRYKPENAKIKYCDYIPSNNYYLPNVVKDIEIVPLKEYRAVAKPNIMEFIKSLIPNIIMCVTMTIMAMSNFTSGNSITSFLMPVSMFLTSVIVPSCFILFNNYAYYKDSKSNINEYLEYLDKYYLELKKNIEEYVKSINEDFFTLLGVKEKIFYKTNNSNNFLSVSIGKTSTSFPLKINNTHVRKIDNMLTQIDNLVSNVEDIPIYLDIRKNKTITIVSRNIDKDYFFYRYLLDLSFCHHFKDLKIAIYSKRCSIVDKVFNLPHLFINGKRNTFNSDEQLQFLNQQVLTSPVIIFMYDKSEFEFSNENIYCIYFSCDKTDILKDTNVLIEYENNYGYIYTDKKHKFKYIHEDTDFVSYFSYLGRYLKLQNINNDYSFIDVYRQGYFTNYNNPHSLCAYFAYNNELISFDLHESKQGPHGLIGGSTGSGKSELIISLLLSLCIKYSPEYLNIVLIDYKGSGILKSLSYQNVVIPHIIASISNLENNVMERLIISLRNECNYRQLLFKKLSNLTNTSIMSIDDYIDNYDKSLPLIAHLLIVVDEFAQLKKENPDVIKELVSLSRIGRSLGLHLILATQKPSGVIDEEIWSNSRFKIALKTFDEKDSLDIIKCKDAAYISEPGTFILNVDGKNTKAHCIYSKTDINDNDPIKVSILDNVLNPIKSHKKLLKNSISSSQYFVSRIIQNSLSHSYKIHSLNYLPPKSMNHNDLNGNKIVLGISDDYINGKNEILSYELNENILICSSRPHEINSVLNTLNNNSRQTIVLSNSTYYGAYISDCLTFDNSDDINYLFNRLLNTNNSNLTIVIEDINCFLSYDDSYLDKLVKLIKRKDITKVNFIVFSNTSQIIYKLLALFSNRFIINSSDNSDIQYLFSYRSKYKGNSYYFDDEPISFVPIQIEKYISSQKKIDNYIPHIPNIIMPNIKNNMILIGYDIKTRKPVYVDSSIKIISLNKELLQVYDNSYKGIKTLIYDNNINNLDSFLWLGKGVYRQRLFEIDFNHDLDDDHGIFVFHNKKILIRRINNAR